MTGATLRSVAKLAGVSPVMVSRVANGSEKVAAATRERVLGTIRDLDYAPNVHATHLQRKTLKQERSDGARDRPIEDNARLGHQSGIPCLPEESFRIISEERKNLVRQLARLREDLDELRRNTERIRRCVEIIHEACSG